MTHLKEKELINEEFDIQFIPSHESSYESNILQQAEEFSEAESEYDMMGNNQEESEEKPAPKTMIQTQKVNLRPPEDDNTLTNKSNNESDMQKCQLSEKAPNNTQEFSDENQQRLNAEDVINETFNTLTDQQLINIFQQFTPLEITPETLYVPFLTSYQPNIGEPDISIRISRPDNKQEPLGTLVYDEPCINQSVGYILTQKLQRLYEELGIHAEADYVSQIETIKMDQHYVSNINKFIQSIDNEHAQKREYQTDVDNFYDLQDLFEDDLIKLLDEVINNSNFTKIDLDLNQYIQLICNLLDVVYDPNDVVGSVYQLFNIYQYAKSSMDMQLQNGM